MGEKTSAVCIPCSRDDITETAIWFCSDCQESICETCATFHKRNKASYKHKLVKSKVTEVLDELNSDTLASSEEIDAPDKCSEHNFKKFKYFCETHDSLCCSRCAIENHRKCKDLLHTSKYTTQKKFRMQIMTIDYDLAMLLENAETIIEYEAECVRKVRKTQEDEIKTGDETRDRLVALVQTVFAERKRAITETSDEIVTKSDKLQAQTKDVLKEIKHFRQMHAQAKAFENEAAKVAVMKLMANNQEKLLIQLKTCFKQLSLETVSSHLEVGALKKSLSQIPHTQTNKIIGKIPLFTENPKVCSTVTMSHKKESLSCVRECCMLDSGIILATDASAKVVRKINSILGQELESFKVESEPWGISNIHPDIVVVSLPFAKKLQFMSYSSGNLKVSSFLATESECFSIASFRRDNKNLLIAYSKTQAKFVLVDTDTRVFENMEIPEIITRRNIAAFINQIAVNETGSQVYLSCYKAHTVFGCDFDGHLLWQFANDLLHTPFGLAVDGHGNIMVCSYGTWTILCISSEGEPINVYINNDKLSEPVALAYTKEFDRLAVCEYDQGYRVKVFKTGTKLCELIQF